MYRNVTPLPIQIIFKDLHIRVLIHSLHHSLTVIFSDSTYHITVDQMPFLKGNLLEDLTPAINPLKEVDDPEDKMPENWDEREQ